MGDARRGQSLNQSGRIAGDPPLSDGRTGLRRWREADVDCIRLAATDPEIPAGTSVPATFTVVEGLAFIHRQWSRAENGTRFHSLYFDGSSKSGRVYCPGMTASVNFATDVVTARVPQRCLVRAGFGHRRYLAVGYAATPGLWEAGDATRFRWVPYN